MKFTGTGVKVSRHGMNWSQITRLKALSNITHKRRCWLAFGVGANTKAVRLVIQPIVDKNNTVTTNTRFKLKGTSQH
jgi:hypothetical protein